MGIYPWIHSKFLHHDELLIVQFKKSAAHQSKDEIKHEDQDVVIHLSAYRTDKPWKDDEDERDHYGLDRAPDHLVDERHISEDVFDLEEGIACGFQDIFQKEDFLQEVQKSVDEDRSLHFHDGQDTVNHWSPP